MLNTELKINKAFKEQVEIYLEKSTVEEKWCLSKKCWKREHLCYFTSDVLWKQKEHDIQGIEFNSLLYYGKLCMSWLYVLSQK